MDAKDTNTAYPREVLDMLARLYNASRENKEEEEEKVMMRSSRMLERENNQTEQKEQGEQGEEAEEEVVEEVDNLLAQMYNSSEGGLASALLQVVLEGRKEKEEEEEMMERCSREEERVYQVKRFFHFFYNLTRRPISVIHYVHQVALMTIAHIAVWPKAQSFSEANKPDCVHCLYR